MKKPLSFESIDCHRYNLLNNIYQVLSEARFHLIIKRLMTTRNDSKVSFLKLVFLKSIQLVVSFFILLIRSSSFHS
ncbi:hypothetical protein HMPREF0352_1060 [Enterococcus faecium TX1330]|nr:hypothetical protein HMPREF0352_1060 [Enterococcus faecium TX1330]